MSSNQQEMATPPSKEIEQTGMFVNHYELPCDCPKPTKTNIRKGRYLDSKIEWIEPSPYGWDYTNPEYYKGCEGKPELLDEFKRKYNDLRSEWKEVFNFYNDFIPADCSYCVENFNLDDEGNFMLDRYGKPQRKNEITNYERWLKLEDENVRLWEKGTPEIATTEKPTQNIQDLIGWDSSPVYGSSGHPELEYESWKWLRNPTGLSDDELWEVMRSPTGKLSDGLVRGPNSVNLWKFNPEEIDNELREPDRISLIMKSLDEKGWNIKE